VWRETETINKLTQHTIVAKFSDDGGRNWGEAKTVASAGDKADYPQLLAKDNQPFLVWNTLKDGLQIIAL
jgi:hypothetical protein